MHRAVVVLSVTLAAVAALVSGDPKCVSVDKEIENSLFKTLRSELKKSKSEYISIGDFSIGLPVLIGVRWSGGRAGNFSSLTLSKLDDAAASQLCTRTTSDSTTEILSVNLNFDTLEVDFGSFVIETPLLNIGSDGFSLDLTGENLNVVVVTTTDTKAGTCSVNLDNFKFTSWGSLHVNFGEGIVNWVLTYIFNNFVSAFIIRNLELFGVTEIINNAVKNAAAEIITSSGQAETVCYLIKSLSS